jgi:hypothetical protein
MTKKIKLSYNYNRVLLSDVLPFEAPIIFSNRELYKFTSELDLRYSEKCFNWQKCAEHVESIIKIILGIDQIEQATDYVGLTGEKRRKIKCEQNQTIPFEFSTLHNKNEMRQLSIFHPRNQIMLTDLYDKHKELMIYLCNKSPYSIRHPASISKCYIWKSNKSIAQFDEESIELSDQSYENLKSFFVYKEYSNIFKFYESKKYHSCEKIYNKMAKLDVSKCFQNIYTHSIAWAVYSKDIAKENLDNKKLSWSFADQFDKIMQLMNHNETNGILIGPEISRIFAEIILQGIDNILLESLNDAKLIHKKDYEIYRYVDDYFIFYNEESTYNSIVPELQIALKKFKMSINFQKEVIYDKPIITPISIAKSKISKLLSSEIEFEISKDDKDNSKGRIFVDSSSLITKFKAILKSSNVDYKDILAFSISTIEKRLRKALVAYGSTDHDAKSQRNIIKGISEILEFTFFIYAVSPRVNTTIKMCRVCQQAIIFIKRDDAGNEFKQVVFELIHKNLMFLLKKNNAGKHTQIETLYLLTLLSQLGRLYWLDEKTLANYFGASIDDGINYSFGFKLNYFSITTLIFYMKDKVRYINLRNALIKYIKLEVLSSNFQINKKTENTLLSLDLLASPYIDYSLKKHVLELYSVDENQYMNIINFRENWFTRWNGFDFAKELDTKMSLEVY